MQKIQPEKMLISRLDFFEIQNFENIKQGWKLVCKNVYAISAIRLTPT